MCMYSRKKGELIFKETKRKITVFKILVNCKWDKKNGCIMNGKSPYFGLRYKRGQRYFSDIHISNGMVVDNGLHAYTSKRAANNAYVHDGHVVEMVIPAGTTYALGSSGEIVSAMLRWPNYNPTAKRR